MHMMSQSKQKYIKHKTETCHLSLSVHKQNDQ